MPSAEQTVLPAVVHERAEPAGAEAVCALLGEAAEEAIEGKTVGVLDDMAGVLELSEGIAAAGDGTTAGTFSCTDMVGTAAEDEGCTAGDTLDCALVLSLSPEPPGTVQPIGSHVIPCTLPLPFGAIVENKSSGTSRSPNAQP